MSAVPHKVRSNGTSSEQLALKPQLMSKGHPPTELAAIALKTLQTNNPLLSLHTKEENYIDKRQVSGRSQLTLVNRHHVGRGSC